MRMMTTMHHLQCFQAVVEQRKKRKEKKKKEKNMKKNLLHLLVTMKKMKNMKMMMKISMMIIKMKLLSKKIQICL